MQKVLRTYTMYRKRYAMLDEITLTMKDTLKL